MKVNDLYPSKYVRANDLNGQAVRVTIEDCRLEHFDDESKPLLAFVGKQKGLLLNKTNAGLLAAAMGDETDDWRGREVELYPDRVMFQGRMVDAVRLRVPRPAQPAPAQQSPMQPAQAASMAAQAPVSAPADQPFDDPVPF